MTRLKVNTRNGGETMSVTWKRIIRNGSEKPIKKNADAIIRFFASRFKLGFCFWPPA